MLPIDKSSDRAKRLRSTFVAMDRRQSDYSLKDLVLLEAHLVLGVNE